MEVEVVGLLWCGRGEGQGKSYSDVVDILKYRINVSICLDFGGRVVGIEKRRRKRIILEWLRIDGIKVEMER